jgi:hypothetical protein
VSFNVGDRVHWYEDSGDEGEIVAIVPPAYPGDPETYQVLWDGDELASSYPRYADQLVLVSPAPTPAVPANDEEILDAVFTKFGTYGERTIYGYIVRRMVLDAIKEARK